MEALDEEATQSIKSKSSANGRITNIDQGGVSERSTSTSNVSPTRTSVRF